MVTSISLSQEEARRFLATYHFTSTDLPGVFTRLGTVQYDPLKPVGRNADLVLQARVPGYQVDDWEQAAYTERLIYDAWDKQACLVPASDWVMRSHTREMYKPYHDREIMQADPQLAPMLLAAIDARGPLSSLEFEDRRSMGDQNSWYGQTRTKRILRAMWVSGVLVTHHRQSGRHYYDRPERVIPTLHYQQDPLPDTEAYHRWIIARRFQAVGLLRPNAEACIWSGCGDSATRKQAIAQLVEMGILTPVHVGEKKWLYYILTELLPYLTAPTAEPDPRMRFLGPLDSMLWDRKALQQIFGFDYLWEVYKPLAQRRWGYYVLPVFFKDRFIGRFDSRLNGHTWTILNWWWEEDIRPDAELYDALTNAMRNFMHYLRAQAIQIDAQIEPQIHTCARAVALNISAPVL
ncbi:DNA glycosylase AlkZ-like family protein [Dictyobacter arantiisoli]|uniref:Winged helix-turn-helix domain-containing protein n=1 Tax=Dictyobacter arantiisoli TaxID=2014874 RepID=A0A5A5TJV5_9CHLR|nr:crosslink repair DNA glycosylase YcaQ family protein [Dictyobacter arantiisoli]GCF11901.1 hypothetical protein KDI_54650 [Dictyobacter arantiisoli]